MSKLKKLITEIHHRSLWQVLLIYLGGSWIVFEIVQTVTEGLGLPQWFPAFAALLLLIGLPVVLATAFVREREPTATVSDPTPVPVVEEDSEAQRAQLHDGGEVPASARSVAVLPFANLSGDPENEYFSDGITCDIINHLAKIADLNVISRTSAMYYKNTDKNLRQIGQELGVAGIVEGEVQRRGDRVRINAQLVDASTDGHLWAEQYDRELTDVFAIQSEVALSVAHALAATLTEDEEQRIERTPTENMEAYNLYLLGRHWLIKRVNLEKALEYFQQAVGQDDALGLAYVGLSDTYLMLVYYAGWTQTEAVPKARTAALRALDIDSTLGEAYASLGAVEHWLEWKWDEAKRNYERAIAFNPGYAEAHSWYGQLLGHMGDSQTCLLELERALQLDPVSPIVITNLGFVLYKLGRYDDAIRLYRRVAVLMPDFPAYREWLGLVRRYHTGTARMALRCTNG